MKFIVTSKYSPAQVDPVIKKFIATGGAPAAGVNLIGRWHGMNGTSVAILESDDPKAVFQGYAQWARLMDMSITPCLEDADAGPILAAVVAD